MNSPLDLFASVYNGVLTVLWFTPLLILYGTVFVCTFGPVVWLMIIVPPWSSVIHPMLGQVTVVDQHSSSMFGIRLFGLLVALHFFRHEVDRFTTGDPLSRRSMWIQYGGLAVAIPPFVATYFL